jgi:hypothetical protein
MHTRGSSRTVALLAIGGGVVALVGNVLAPRFNGDNSTVYRDIASSSRFTITGVIILVAILLVTAAFAGLSRIWATDGNVELAGYARLAVVIGGAIALLQIGVELYGYRYQARAFSDFATSSAQSPIKTQNLISAFWATDAFDHLSSALMAVWTLILLGLAPVLLGAAQLRTRAIGARLGLVAVVGGLVCAVVGVASLLHEDQSTFDVPFLIGSLLVTAWLIATGVLLARSASGGTIDVSHSTPAESAVPSST